MYRFLSDLLAFPFTACKIPPTIATTPQAPEPGIDSFADPVPLASTYVDLSKRD